MKTKILTFTALLTLGLVFTSCEKEENYQNVNLSSTEPNKKASIQNKSDSFYGDFHQESLVLEKANATRNYFESQNIVPETEEWFNYFESIYDSGLQTIATTENEEESNELLTDYFEAYYDSIQPDSSDIHIFRDQWLQIVASSQEINLEEKNLISNIIYVSTGVKRMFIDDIIITSEYPPSPDRMSPWEYRFNRCMRRKVPSGFFRRILWVLDGEIFIDVFDCMIEAWEQGNSPN